MTVKEKSWIPEMNREEIIHRAEIARALVRRDGVLWVIKPGELFTEAFTWDPEFAAKAPSLTPICTIITRHRWAYYGFFKPSIAEVIPFIPEALLPEVFGFEVIGPDTASDLNFSRHKEAFNDSFHTAETTLYKLKVSD